MRLSDTQIRNAKPHDKPYKLFDGRGLYLIVRPNGAKWWRLKYRHNGKENSISLGTYPDVGLKVARDRTHEARRQLKEDGIDPSQRRQAARSARLLASRDTFEAVARLWFSKNEQRWKPSHARTVIGRLERDVFPWIGRRPIREITARELRAVLHRVEERGAVETAHRELQLIRKVYSFAIGLELVKTDIATPLANTLAPVKKQHLAAIVDEGSVGPLLRAIDSYGGTFVVKCALRLAPLVFVRPGELRHAEWQEIDLQCAEWLIPADRMKMGLQHLVPLSRQSVELLAQLQPLTGRDRFVFPSARSTSRPMSNNAVLAALRRMGIERHEMTGHGFRAMARTLLDEKLGFRPDIIEYQLAHAVRDPNGRAYNRTTHLPERKK